MAPQISSVVKKKKAFCKQPPAKLPYNGCSHACILYEHEHNHCLPHNSGDHFLSHYRTSPFPALLVFCVLPLECDYSILYIDMADW